MSDQDPPDRGGKPASRRAVVAWLTVIYLLSGICSLMDEVVWARLLMLTLGNTVYASTIVVSTFMAGLALGALIMGRYADRIRLPLRLYAILEILATITAVLIPFALRLADRAYLWSFAALDPSPTLLLCLQIVVSAALLLVPTMLMGSTLPLLSRFVTTVEARAGALVGRLYALNMLGAALGCFLAGFVLIRVVGVMGTLMVAASLNLVVALGGYAVSLKASRTAPDEPEPPATDAQVADLPAPVRTGRGPLIVACFVSGFVSVGYELAWMRGIGYRLGIFTYVFTAVLTAYLLGNVLGALLGSRLSKWIKNPAVGFGCSLACLGVAGTLFAPWIVYWYGDAQARVGPIFEALARKPALNRTVEPLLHCLTLFLVPSILMGVGFPLAIQAWNDRYRRVGRSTATVYGANTIGSVSGGAVTGLLLIPLLGMQASLNTLGMLSAATGALLALVSARGKALPLKLATVVVALLAVAGGLAVPRGLINRELLVMPGMQTYAVVEGVNATASMREQRGPSGATRWLASANVVVGGTGDSRTAQKTLGHLGLMLNPAAREVLSVGFGSGETTLCLSKHSLDRIDCVEIAPEMVELALEHLNSINLGDQLDERINMIYMDAKNYLHLTTRQYDLILNDSNNPAQPGSAPLFAREHFENALAHLNPGGLFITKLHIGEPISQIESILGTFAEVFPSVSIWFPVTRPYPFFYVAGSRERQMFSPRSIDRLLQNEAVRESVDYLFWQSSQDVLSGYLGDEQDLSRQLGEYSLNSDLQPFVEFNLDPQDNTIQGGYFSSFVETLSGNSIVEHLDWGEMTESEQQDWLARHQATRRVSALLLDSFSRGQAWEMLLANYQALKAVPGSAALKAQQTWILKEARKGVTKTSAAGFLNVSSNALRGRPDFTAALVIQSWALARMDRHLEALNVAKEAARQAPDSSMALENLGMRLFQRGQYEQAAEQFLRALELAEDGAELHFHLAETYRMLGRTAEAREQYEQVLLLDSRHPGALARRAGADS